MRDEEEDMVVSGREVWIGLERTNHRTAYLFHIHMWVSMDETSSQEIGEYEVYYISPRGLAALDAYDEENK
ncbi:MAG: hypothetical protein GTO24_21195 [candidate division Zixibacteria bacterium]|nr:hypothetical protein [candidate division Zixibacteria bacterium]